MVDPILAFVKAHRLRGDYDSLKVTLFEHFDTSKLSSTVRALYEFCRSDLVRLGFIYQARGSSDKRQLFNSLFTDLMSAFDNLDGDNLLPSIFCESLDLIYIPTLAPDPVCKQLDLNTKAISALKSTVTEMPASCSQLIVEQVSESLKSLKELVTSANVIKNELSATVDTAMKSLVSKSSISSSAKLVKPQLDRSANVIVFGLPEST